MIRSLRSLAVLALGLVFVGGHLFGQGLLPKKIWDLTITVNVPNASLYVDNVLIQGNTTKVAGGAHNLKVHADGYADFNGPVTVNGNMTYAVRLNPLAFPLTIRVAAQNARIFVDGRDVTGMLPSVPPGSHTLQVTAPGYQDYNATVNVNGPLSLQIAMQPAWSLMINVNVPNAAIAIDNVPLSGNVAQVAGGAHTLTVHADGYADYTGSLNVNGNMTFAVRLNPLGVALTIRVAAQNATVSIDGNNVSGTAPLVAMGSHTIRVTAPGYQDYNATVNVTAPMSLDVALQPAGFPLTVTTNVSNATISVNNVAKGNAPYAEILPPGTYTVRASADGYSDYVASVALNQATTVNVQLKPQMSFITFVIPPIFKANDLRPNDPQGLVKIYVDNALVNPNRELERIAVLPGRHRIRIASGAFSVQLGDMAIDPGMIYTIELSLNLQVQSTQASQ